VVCFGLERFVVARHYASKGLSRHYRVGQAGVTDLGNGCHANMAGAIDLGNKFFSSFLVTDHLEMKHDRIK
jgi:hypothetical protein